MLRLRRPTTELLEKRRARSRAAPLSVRPEVIGATVREEVPEDYTPGEWEISLGGGAAAFDRACEAIRRWDQFPESLVEIHPNDAPIEVGVMVALSAHAGGIHADFACRIVATIDDVLPLDPESEPPHEIRRFGFVYATIEGHVERGEELFLIEHDLADDSVTYRIRAVSRPAHPLAWFVQPWIRGLQKRFGRESAEAMRRAIDAADDLPRPTEVHRRPPFGLPWIGALIWALSFVGESVSVPMRLVTFAALVALPASRALLPSGWLRSDQATAIWAVSAVSLALAPWVGELLWLLATAGVGARAGYSLLARRERPEQSGALLGLTLLPIGAAWAGMVRVGAWPGEFPVEIAELTAAHFHYAGALLPIVLGRAVSSWRPEWVLPAVIATAVSVAGVALGISFSPSVEGASALTLIAIVFVIGALQLRAAILGRSRLGSTLLGLGSLALFLGMGLAATYALSEWIGSTRDAVPYSGGGVISLDQMISWHGFAMAIGFSLCSVIGWDALRECAPISDADDRG